MRYAALALLALTLAGCGGTAAQPAAKPTVHTATTSTADIAYLAAIRPHVQGSSDADLIALGHTACAGMDGSTMLNEASTLTDQGFTADAAAAIVTAAIPAYCPEYSAQLTP